MALSARLRRYDNVLLDLDGTVWIGDEPTPRAAEAVSALREAGKGVMFLTNNPWRSGEDTVRRLWRLGFRASVDEVVTVGGALQHYLAGRGGGSAFVIGAPVIHTHVTDAGMRVVNGTDLERRPDVVVVAGHNRFSYDELRTALQALDRGAGLIGTGRDATAKMPDGRWPGSGAVLAAVEYAAGRTADVVIGKPEREIFAAALDRLGDGKALMVGDLLEADIAGAGRVGIDAALVLTGVSTRAEAEAAPDPKPVAIADSLADLVLR